MKYLTLMTPGLLPVTVLFSHHVGHEELTDKIGWPVLGAGYAQIHRDGAVTVIPPTELDTPFKPNSELDPALIAHDLKLTGKLFPKLNCL